MRHKRREHPDRSLAACSEDSFRYVNRPVRRLLIQLAIPFVASLLFGPSARAQPSAPFTAPGSGDLSYKQFGELAVQDGGRRKPVDTFARESLIRISGRSAYTDKAGRTWRPEEFVLSALLESHDWQAEPMILVSLGKLKEQLGLSVTQRRFTFTELNGRPELNRLISEAHGLRAAEKPLDRLQSEALAVGDRLGLLAHIMDGSAFLIVPAADNESNPWVVPPEFSRYYSEQQFEPARTQLQAVATAYSQVDGFQFSRASKLLGEALRSLSPENLSA
jgi:hypothetical protein